MTRSREEEKEAIIRDLRVNTGRDLAEWVDIVETEGPEETEERLEWLREIHSLDFLQAQTIVEETEHPSGRLPRTDEGRVDAQFAGKDDLQPTYERLLEAVSKLPEASVQPHYSYIALMRGDQEFGILYVGEEHLDLGLNLMDVEPTSRLEPAGIFGALRITHRVTLRASSHIDDDVVGWIQQAYEANE